jgi:transposase
MKRPELVTATQAQLDELLALAKASFPHQQYQLLEGVLGTFVHVMLTLQNAKTSIKRFRKVLFGARTELKRNVLEDHHASAAGNPPAGAGPTPAEADHDGAPPPRALPGHGRNGAQAYRDAPIVECDHHDLHPGDRCPQCDTGKVYDSPPRTIVKVVGQAPLAATIYRLQRLRCRLCDAIFTAPLPEAVASLPKYDPSCASMIALLRYGNGMPHYRLEGLQASLYVPLPDSTQWDIVSKAVPGPRAAFEELIRQAAQAPLLHNDDTPARVLSLMAERAKAEAAGRTPKAKAINTSGIVAVVQERKVVLFFTGHAHAGKNLEQVLAHRARELEPPLQMCDALASNVVGEFATVVCNCLAHGRRTVVDVVENFPQACGHVIEVLAKVYEHDASCRRDKMSPEQRLSFHQDHSGPLMQGLKTWMSEQLEQRQVEPNSGLGQALRYLLNHWTALTLFLRKAGAPLDNNVCERALKRAILHRKNSLFYKTLNGAAVGDIYMSLIHTCRLCDVNPFEYLQALQKHAQDVHTCATQWLPWNYREQLALVA